MAEKHAQPDKPPLGRIVIEFDPGSGNTTWRKEGGDMPFAVAVNMLELVKHFFIGAQMQSMKAQAAQQNARRVVLPDGSIPPINL